MKLYLEPSADDVKSDNGVGQVVLAQYKYLPNYGIQFVHNPGDADIVASHIHTDLDYIDVLHCHGLYWTAEKGEFNRYHYRTNQRIMSAARKARAVTVPSQWVGEPFKREMRIDPVVIGHGINVNEWSPVDNPDGYILWNKNRVSPACDPSPAIALFKLGHHVMSTFGLGEMDELGSLPFDEMKKVIQSAGIYLSTSKETFGIGTLEAMACGIPILGYSSGGNIDIVEHGVTGYLVSEGDIQGLARGVVEIRENYSRMSEACKLSAKTYDWENVISQYADLYRSLLNTPETHKTAAVITNYNYGRYVKEAIESCVNQSVPFDEIIIVDDGSTDNSDRVITDYNSNFSWSNPRLKIIRQKNQGVASARNRGIAESSADYVVCLDADDKLGGNYLKELLPPLRGRRELGIVYGSLEMFKDDGTIMKSGWPPKFDWEVQSTVSVPPSNCIPSGALFRKSMWERAGGIIQQGNTPGEDVEFWTRGLSRGFEAKKVTDKPIFKYRIHEGQAHKSKKYKRIDSWMPWMVSKDHPIGSPTDRILSINSYSNPIVSVIIPVGPGHEDHILTAVESALSQSFKWIEVIVVKDTPNPLPKMPAVKVVECDMRSAGGARNTGCDYAKGNLLYFLDSDDYLMPGALENIVTAYGAQDGKYIYTSYYIEGENGRRRFQKLRSYDQTLYKGQHAVNILISRKDFVDIGGFDHLMNGWEDWDFQLRMQVNGVCGYYLNEPTFVYRSSRGYRRDYSHKNKDKLLNDLNDRYGNYFKGNEKMASCCNADSAEVVKILLNHQRSLGRLIPQTESVQFSGDNTMARMEYTGSNPGAITFERVGGESLSKKYRGGSSPSSKFANVEEIDVKLLLKSGKWKLITPVGKNTSSESQVDIPMPTPSEPFAIEIDSHPSKVIIASAKVRKEAEVRGLDLDMITGTGYGGRIVMADLDVD